MPNTFPTSILTLDPLQQSDTPSLLDIRPFLQNLSGQMGPMLIMCERIQQAFDHIQQVLRTSSPSLSYLEIDAADIQTLYVGGQFGPGELTVLNGQPNYDAIGWIGSQAKATSVTITSIVAGLVTTAAPHELKAGDNVFIEATTDSQNTGFYVVATTPLTTTFTVSGGVGGGDSTGGDMTKQFQGAWVKMFACGGTAFDNAPFQVDVDGTLSITDALIRLSHTSGGVTSTITLDPSNASIVVASSLGSELILQNGFLQFNGLDGGGSVDPDAGQATIELGLWQMFAVGITAEAASRLIDLYGYTGATEFGPLLSLSQLRGTPSSPGATQTADTMGGVICWGYDGVGESEYSAGILALATENHGATAHGSKIVINVTPTGTTSPTTQFTFDGAGSMNLATSYKVANTQVVSTRKTGWTAATGTPTRSSFATGSVTLPVLAEHLKALLDDLISHGLIG